jgi:hypothetical protein
VLCCGGKNGKVKAGKSKHCLKMLPVLLPLSADIHKDEYGYQ